jgi:hypothetical protein
MRCLTQTEQHHFKLVVASQIGARIDFLLYGIFHAERPGGVPG